MPEEVRESLKFVLAERVDDVFEAALVPDGRKGDGAPKRGSKKREKANQ